MADRSSVPLPDDDPGSARVEGRLALRLLRYGLPYRYLMALTVLLVLAVPTLDLIGTIIVKLALDGPLHDAIEEGAGGAAAGAPLAATPSAGDPLTQLWTLSAIYAGIMVLFVFLRYAQGLFMAKIGQHVMRDVRMEVFTHLQRMPLAFFDHNPVGRLVTRITNDVEALNQLFSSGVVALAADVLLLSGITFLLFYYSVDLALVTIAVVPFLLVTTFVFRAYARRFYREQRGHLSRLNAFTHEALQGIDVVQLFAREKDTRDRFAEINGNYLRAFLKTVLAYSVYFPVLEILTASALVAILWRGGYLMGIPGEGRLGFGDFYLFWRFLDRFTMPIRDIAERYNVLQAAMAAAERIFGILDAPETIRDRPDAVVPTVLRGDVDLDHVSFSYNGVDYALRDFGASVKAGETIAIVGATGAGKSTIINLLGRFYEPQRGRILVDGLDLQTYDKRAYRRRLATVLQDPFVFSRSVLENITLGNPQITEAAARDAARRVNANDFIESLPQRYHTILSERGGTLSVGQRQLLVFARALAHDPDILILDEATAHVDTETERLIETALSELLRGRTSFVIAHRLSTVQRAHRILVLHKGQLREEGSHQELLAKKGIYHRLYQLQFLEGATPP